MNKQQAKAILKARFESGGRINPTAKNIKQRAKEDASIFAAYGCKPQFCCDACSVVSLGADSAAWEHELKASIDPKEIRAAVQRRKANNKPRTFTRCYCGERNRI